MRRGLAIGFILSLTLTSGTLIGAATLAASYQAPAEQTVYEFGTMDSSDRHFQELGYYFASGAGTLGDPFIVKNSQQLRNLAKLQNSGAFPNGQYVSLGTSFQYEGAAMEPIGNATYPWTGVFNGEHHIITKLNVTTSTVTNVGMFGVVGANDKTGTVYQLVLAGPSVTYTGSSAVNIGFIAGSRNITVGHVSVVKNIEIYGGTATFTNMRAFIRSGGTPTCADGVVGLNGEGDDEGPTNTAGFVSTLSSNPTYGSTAKYAGVTAASTNYYIYNNGSGATHTTSI